VNYDNEKMCEIRDSFINLNAPKLHDSDPTDDLLKDASKIMSQWVDNIIEQGDNKNKIRTISGGTISLGDIAVVFTPLELAWQIGSRIREKSSFPVTLISTASLGFESYITEKKFYELKPELRPYETFGLQVMAGFSYTPETPSAFEAAVINRIINL